MSNATSPQRLPLFERGQVITQISPDGLVVDYYVAEVIAADRLRVHPYDEHGQMTERWRYLGAGEIARCRLNAVASRLVREMAAVPSSARESEGEAPISQRDVVARFARHG